MKEYRQPTPIEVEIAQVVLDFPPEGQCFIRLAGQTYLLSFSSTVGEENTCKIWIQGSGAIKVGTNGPVTPYNQLIYKANVIDGSHIKLHDRHGYPEITHGEELLFLNRLLHRGSPPDWIVKPGQTI